jgi:2-polyprenyl-3-methyl-5-hydroxy-6-metoxy-1,4-benzoquinol methylase
MITAMDVFEHLSDPLGTVDHIARALQSGGFLFGRFAVEKMMTTLCISCATLARSSTVWPSAA